MNFSPQQVEARERWPRPLMFLALALTIVSALGTTWSFFTGQSPASGLLVPGGLLLQISGQLLMGRSRRTGFPLICVGGVCALTYIILLVNHH